MLTITAAAVPDIRQATTAATTASAVAGLVVMHLTIGAAVIPAMARTVRAR